MTHDPLTFGNLFGSMRGAEFAPSDYEQGQADMLAKCIAAVTKLHTVWYAGEPDHACMDQSEHDAYGNAEAALRALQEKP